MLHHETPINKRQIALTAGFVGYHLPFVIMLHHETPINKRQIALTAGFVGYAEGGRHLHCPYYVFVECQLKEEL